MSRVGIYQATAARYGTVIERADPNIVPRIGGAITKHSLACDVAQALVHALRNLGAEAKTYNTNEPGDDRLFVYLSGCSFQKGDKLTENDGAPKVRS